MCAALNPNVLLSIKRRTCRWVKTSYDVSYWWTIPFAAFSDGVTYADDESITISSPSEFAEAD